LPVPLAPAVIVIQDAPLDAVQEQLLPTVTATVPVPPDATAVALVGESV
jgi:enterochelin esterase-like enzyme